MIEAQADIPFAPPVQPPRKARGVTPEGIERVRIALADGRWHTARELAASTGLGDRHLRWVAEERDTEFVSGNKGYRLFSACTAEELCVCADRLLSQGKKMIRRAVALRAAAHRAVNSRPSTQPVHS